MRLGEARLERVADQAGLNVEPQVGGQTGDEFLGVHGAVGARRHQARVHEQLGPVDVEAARVLVVQAGQEQARDTAAAAAQRGRRWRARQL